MRTKIYTTAPLEDPRKARTVYKELEDIGYDGGFSCEAKHDPFLALAVAAEDTTTLRLGTAIAIAFARNPMNLANLGYDMQSISGGPLMTAAAGEVADGFIAHPFTTRRSLLEISLPALQRGLAKAGRRRSDIEVMCATLVVTADTEEALATSKLAARKQLAFYGSTPAYLPTLATGPMW
jgi:alkanesulfonate monooxygenase SsuD/methylene tetrahydromethanopterin reductase-like flavin-dependent oxidoreductase (luciferase family)